MRLTRTIAGLGTMLACAPRLPGVARHAVVSDDSASGTALRPQDLEGTWLVGRSGGHEYHTEEHYVTLQSGVAKTSSRYADLTSPDWRLTEGKPGAYRILADGSLQVDPLGERTTFALTHERNTVMLTPGAIRVGRVYRRVLQHSPGVTSVAEWHFAQPLSGMLLGGSCSAHITVSVREQERELWKESALWHCSREGEPATWLTFTFNEVGSSGWYESAAPTPELREIVGKQVQRSFHFNPIYPDLIVPTFEGPLASEGIPWGWLKQP